MIEEKGIRVGLNSTTMDDAGFYAGADYSYDNAKAAVMADGRIKGANGNFTVTDDGKVTTQGLDVNNHKITQVAEGTETTDAVNYGQLAKTNNNVNAVANYVVGVNDRVNNVESRVGNAERRISNLEGRVDKVGANAAAMANLHPMEFDEDTKLSVAGAIGNYGSATAAAVGVFYRPTERVMFNVSSSFGNGETMVGGGVSFALGRSEKKVKEEKIATMKLNTIMAKLQELQDKQARLEQENAELKAKVKQMEK